MLSRIFAFTLLVSIPAFADDCDPQVVDPGVIRDLGRVASRMKTTCPNQLDVPGFCAAVESKIMENQPAHPSVTYRYQSMIYSASCIEASDSDETIKAKVQNFWNTYHSRLTCNTINFNPRNGNILKLAVARQSASFINDAVSTWNVGLNHVDAVDNGTVLDYIEQRKNQAGTASAFGKTLQRYYDKFRAAGAKHSREL